MGATDIRFERASDLGGREVLGASLKDCLDDKVVRSLRDACVAHSFLVIRDQQITFEDQLRFGTCFGRVLETDPPTARTHETDIDETRRKYLASELSLHFDHWLVSGIPQPLRFTMLYALQVTPVGGETVLANTKTAYRRLPTCMKDRIANLHAEHYYDYSEPSGERNPSRIRASEIPPGQPRASHPVVLAHPETGESILYVSPRNTDRVLDVHPEEGEELLQMLFSDIQSPTNVYAHKWRAGDVLVWDNYAMLHGRKEFDYRYPRKLQRLSIL